MPYSVSLFITKMFRELCNHRLWAYLRCYLNHRKMRFGSGFRITLSHLLLGAKSSPKLDEGTEAFIKPSSNSLKKWRSRSLSGQLFSNCMVKMFLPYIQLQFLLLQFVLAAFCCVPAPLRRTWLWFLLEPPAHGRQHWGPLLTCSFPGSTIPAFSAYQILISQNIWEPSLKRVGPHIYLSLKIRQCTHCG